jgi:hypothetical protein
MPAELIALLDEGHQLWRDGQLPLAQLRLEEALARAAALGNVAGLLSARHLLGNLAYDQGDLAAAREHHLFVLTESEALGLPAGVASSLHNLGLVAARAGDLPAARGQLLAAAERYGRLAMHEAAAAVRSNLARIEGWSAARGDDTGFPRDSPTPPIV